MKEIVVISGKGGTGKTSFTASIAYLSSGIVVADCDVDAANLAIILSPAMEKKEKFIGGKKAEFSGNKAENCEKCQEICRFNAINNDCTVDKYSCEGCGACYYLCPEGMYKFESAECGEWYLGKISENKYIAYAELDPGEDNSGKLSTVVRNQASYLAKKHKIETVLIDGPPGIGCPVIASITGSSHVIIVTEPTKSGFHDLKRAVKLCENFKVPVSIVVNKIDLNPDYAKDIKQFCYDNKLNFLGTISYDSKVQEALEEGQPIVEFCPDCKASKDITEIFNKLKNAELID